MISAMASTDEEEKRKRKEKKMEREKRKEEKKKKDEKRKRKRSYSSYSEECARCSRKKKKAAKKAAKKAKKPKRKWEAVVLNDDVLGVMGLKAWNKQQRKSGGSQYEFVRALVSYECMKFLEGWIYHVNFEAKPASSSDEQVELFFAELKQPYYLEKPRVTLCCPVQVTASDDAGLGSGSADEPGGGLGDASGEGSADAPGGGLADAPVGGSGGGTLGSSAEALVCDSGGASGGGGGGSDGAVTPGSGDGSSGSSDYSSEDDSSEDDSSSDDGDDFCRFCLEGIIHPPRGFDGGNYQSYIKVDDSIRARFRML